MLGRLALKQPHFPLFHELLRHSNTHAIKNDSTLIPISHSLQGWKLKLKAAGIGYEDFNLRSLLECVLKKKLDNDYADVQLTRKQLTAFGKLFKARCDRQPLQHLVGECKFMNFTLKTHPEVFIPRVETEEFVAVVIEKLTSMPKLQMLEVGCGSGAISLAILKALPHVHSTAFDMCEHSTTLAKQNAKMLRQQDRMTVYTHTMTKDDYVPKNIEQEKFDVIVSNPPYVTEEEISMLQPEVWRYENINAWDGGKDGLDVVRQILDLATKYLKPKGKLFLEVGSSHPPLVKTIVNWKYYDELKFLSTYQDKLKRDKFVEILKT